MPLLSAKGRLDFDKKFILVGGGGFARELVDYIRYEYENSSIGIIDFNPSCEVIREDLNLEYLGVDLNSITMAADSMVLIAIGDPVRRFQIAKMLKCLNAELVGFVHNSAHVATDAIIGNGAIVCPFAIVNAGAIVGECSLINVHSTLGHGVKVGVASVLSPYSSLSGDAVVGDRCFLGTRATLFPRVSIGNDCTVDSHSVVRKSVGDGMMVSNRPKYLVAKNRIIDRHDL